MDLQEPVDPSHEAIHEYLRGEGSQIIWERGRMFMDMNKLKVMSCKILWVGSGKAKNRQSAC